MPHPVYAARSTAEERPGRARPSHGQAQRRGGEERKRQMNWRWLAFEKRRGHAVPEALAAAIIGDVGGTPIKDVPLIELHIDIGGGGYLNAPREHTEIDGFTIILPSGDLPLLFAQLARITD